MANERICLITFSDNADHQNVVYSMFEALYPKHKIYTVGLKNPKSLIAPHTDNNFYFDCPLRPGITKGTFRLRVLRKIAKTIKEYKIKYLYFESMHLWNVLLMMLCPRTVKVVAVHDVIPHDKNHAMAACNFVTCKMADHIILRNKKYKKVLAEKYRLPEREITCLELWRHFPPEMCSPHSGKFLCFGRIRKYKGFDLLEGIIGRTPQIQYQVVGEPDEESIAIVNKLKKYPNVFVDDREVSDKEMENYFKGADWAVLPYASATQSGVIVDACKYSRPVIAFNVGAISEQVKEGETGFLVPQKDVKGFVNVISKVNKFSAEELDDFSHNAYMFGYQKYAAEAVADKFLQIILKCKKNGS